MGQVGKKPTPKRSCFSPPSTFLLFTTFYCTMPSTSIGPISRPRRLKGLAHRLRFVDATFAETTGPSGSPETDSDGSEVITPASSIIFTLSRSKLLDANGRFIAIRQVANLLHSVANKSDIEALHALAEIFLLCLKNILLSFKHLSPRVRSVPDFGVAYRGVIFFGKMFAGRVKSGHDSSIRPPTHRRVAVVDAIS